MAFTPEQIRAQAESYRKILVGFGIHGTADATQVDAVISRPALKMLETAEMLEAGAAALEREQQALQLRDQMSTELPPEAAKIIRDNLWSLYDRTDP